MAAIAGSIEIARRPEDVFAYATDPSRFPECQASAVSVRPEGTGPPAVGSSTVVTRRLGPRKLRGTEEITQLTPPPGLGVAHGRRPGHRDGQRHGGAA
jgi:Polyketide cyclase / dehydrase and lipid transport